MKKLIPLLLSSVLLVSVAACQDGSKTSADAPNDVNNSANGPSKETAQNTQSDATSDTRKAQIESDIRTR